jgi:hypothetical protein
MKNIFIAPWTCLHHFDLHIIIRWPENVKRVNKICIHCGHDEPISLTNEYKYLGILFKPSGTFSDAIDYLSKKACKAMFCIRKSLYSNKSNIPIHMKLFEACVKSILLYCSEVWSLPQLIKGRDITNFESNYEKFVPNR